MAGPWHRTAEVDGADDNSRLLNFYAFVKAGPIPLALENWRGFCYEFYRCDQLHCIREVAFRTTV
jgi:hypothetical protein